MATEASTLTGYNAYGGDSNVETPTFQRDSTTATQDREVQPGAGDRDPLDIWAEGGDPESPQDVPETQGVPQYGEQDPTAEQAWQQMPQAPYQPPAPMEGMQGRLAQLQAAQVMEQQLVQAHAQYLTQEEAQVLYARHQQASLQRAAEAMQLQNQMEKAALEGPARTLVMEYLAQEIQRSSPDVDVNVLKEFLADAESPQEMMRSLARFERMHKSANLKVRAKSGVDKVGETSQGGDSMAGKSVMDLLSMGFTQNERNHASRRFRSF